VEKPSDINTQVTLTVDELGDDLSKGTLLANPTLLSLYKHKYLPNEQVTELLRGMSGYTITNIVNIMKPDIVVRFERKWKEMRELRGDDGVKPEMVFHGTPQERIGSILEKGLLVPGTGQVTHTTDSGFWGKGIYLSPNFSMSLGYARNSQRLFVCSVLMGKVYDCKGRMMNGKGLMEGYDSHRQGGEWIVFDCAQVLPSFMIEFTHAGQQNHRSLTSMLF